MSAVWEILRLLCQKRQARHLKRGSAKVKALKKYAVGEVRPTQLLLNYGIGSIIDLPHISTLVMGLDDWDTAKTLEINEERLLHAVQARLAPR